MSPNHPRNPDPSTTQAAQLQTCLTFCKALNTADLSTIRSCISPTNIIHRYIPRTLGPAAEGTRNFDETMTLFAATFESVVQRMGIELPPMEVVQGKNKIVFLVRDRGVKKDGREYDVEYVMIFGFEEGAEKIGELLSLLLEPRGL